MQANSNHDEVVTVVTILLTRENERWFELAAESENKEPEEHIRAVVLDRLHVPPHRIVIRDARATASASGRALPRPSDRWVTPGSSNPAANDNAEQIVRIVTLLLTRENEQQIAHLASMYDRMTIGKYIRRQISDRWFVPAYRIQIRESHEVHGEPPNAHPGEPSRVSRPQGGHGGEPPSARSGEPSRVSRPEGRDGGATPSQSAAESVRPQGGRMTPGQIGRALARLDIYPDASRITSGTVIRIHTDELIDVMRELGGDLGPGAVAYPDIWGGEGEIVIEIPSADIGLVAAAYEGRRLTRRQRRRLARGEVV